MRSKSRRHVKGARGTDSFKDRSRTHAARAVPYETCSGIGGACVFDKNHPGPCSEGGGSDE